MTHYGRATKFDSKAEFWDWCASAGAAALNASVGSPLTLFLICKLPPPLPRGGGGGEVGEGRGGRLQIYSFVYYRI